MRATQAFSAFGPGLLIVLFGCTSQKSDRILVDREAIRIIVEDSFPQDMTADIYVGSQAGQPYRDSRGKLEMHPYIRTEGEKGQITNAEIRADLSTTVSIRRKD